MTETGNADMLRVARQLRGFQQGDAAERLGVSLSNALPYREQARRRRRRSD